MENIIYVIFCFFIAFFMTAIYKIFEMIRQINRNNDDMYKSMEDIKNEQEYILIDIVNKTEDLEYIIKDLEYDINKNIDNISDEIHELNKRIEELEQHIIDLLIDENE